MRKAGFTLLELVMATSITLVLMGMLMEASRTSSGLNSTTLSLGLLDEKSSHAVAQMRSELRWAQVDTMLLTVQDGSDRVDFVVAEDYDGTDTVWSTMITYVWEPLGADTNENGILDEGQLVRIQDGRRRVLCRNVSQGGLSIDLDVITLTVGLTVFGLNKEGQLLEETSSGTVALMNREEA